jgi:hypothetical protein
VQYFGAGDIPGRGKKKRTQMTLISQMPLRTTKSAKVFFKRSWRSFLSGICDLSASSASFENPRRQNAYQGGKCKSL